MSGRGTAAAAAAAIAAATASAAHNDARKMQQRERREAVLVGSRLQARCAEAWSAVRGLLLHELRVHEDIAAKGCGVLRVLVAVRAEGARHVHRGIVIRLPRAAACIHNHEAVAKVVLAPRARVHEVEHLLVVQVLEQRIVLLNVREIRVRAHVDIAVANARRVKLARKEALALALALLALLAALVVFAFAIIVFVLINGACTRVILAIGGGSPIRTLAIVVKRRCRTLVNAAALQHLLHKRQQRRVAAEAKRRKVEAAREHADNVAVARLKDVVGPRADCDADGPKPIITQTRTRFCATALPRKRGSASLAAAAVATLIRR